MTPDAQSLGLDRDRLRIRLLGPFVAERGGAPIAVSGGISRAVLARLALSPGIAIPGEVLLADLRDDRSEAALATLRSQFMI